MVFLRITRALTGRRIAFRALRRVCAIYERRRVYPLRESIWDYVFSTSPDSARVFLIVLAAGYVSDAAWAAASFLSNSGLIAREFRLVFCIHGDLPSLARARLRGTFPSAEIVGTKDVIRELNMERLAGFAKAHPLGGKLAALIFYGANNSLLYSDSDVLAFAPVLEIDAALNRGRTMFMTQSEQGCYDPGTAAVADSLGYTLPKAVNSGILIGPAGTFERDRVEQLVPEPATLNDHSATWWWIEQTIVAALMGKCEGMPLPLDRYVVSTQRQLPFDADLDYERIAVRHFISPVRHLMYAKGIPIILAKFSNNWEKQRSVNAA